MDKHVATGLCSVQEVRNRSIVDARAEIRAADGEGAARRFVGHAAVFNSRTAIGNPLTWGWYEEIDPAAFDKTLAEADVRFLVDHDSSKLVARTSAGDLSLSTDSVGVLVDAGLDEELSYVKDLTRNLDKRRITGMSIGFYVVRDEKHDEQVETSDGQTVTVEVRRILEVRLLEVSAVTFPAYEETDANLRSICTQVRAERFPTTTTSPSAGESSAPADQATRSTEGTAPADEATRGLATAVQLRHRGLAARYGLDRLSR